MSDETNALAEYGHNPKFDSPKAAEALLNAGQHQRAPASAGEVAQRRANKANHSERVRHGGNLGAGEKLR